MLTEFPERFQRLLAGPMWSGLDPQDMKDPMKVKEMHELCTKNVGSKLLFATGTLFGTVSP